MLRLASLLAAALLALPSVAASHDPLAAPPSGATCVGTPLLYCADATATASVSCTVTATDYTCTLSATWGHAGSTSGPQGGEVSGPGWLDISVCDGFACDNGVTWVGAPCSWALGGHGCSATGSHSETVSGPHAGCIEVAVSMHAEAYVQFPGVPLTLVQDQAFQAASFANC